MTTSFFINLSMSMKIKQTMVPVYLWNTEICMITWSFFIRHSNLDPYMDVIEVFKKELVRWYGKLSLNILTPCSILVLVSVSMYSRHPISHCPVVSDLKTVKFSLFVSNVVSTWKVLGFSSKSWAFIDAKLEPVTRQLLSSFSVIRMLNLQPV